MRTKKVSLSLLLSVLFIMPLQMKSARAATAPSTSPAIIDVGVQPLGFPDGMMFSVMKRDLILKQELARKGFALSMIPYKRGGEMIDIIGNGQLEAASLGDMPTIRTAIRTDIWVIGLVNQAFTSIVAKNISTLEELKGKRIGFGEGSTAHHTLLQGLMSAGLGEKDVKLIPLDVDEMPTALTSGKIDAFSSWEPAPSIALAMNPANRVIFRGMSSDYFVMSRTFERSNPDAARILVAGYVRAFNWMRKKAVNVDRAAQWTITDGEMFSATPSKLTATEGAAIARREILSIPSAPAIVKLPGEKPRLEREMEFLKNLGKVPASADAARLRSAFDYDGIARVLKESKKFRIHEFNYEP